MKTKEQKNKPSKLIRKKTRVMAIAGNERGQIGEVLSVNGDKVTVQGLNMCKKHVKPNQQMQKGGIIEMERPIHISNLRVCVDDKPVKIKTRVNDQNERELYYKDSSGKEVLYRAEK